MDWHKTDVSDVYQGPCDVCGRCDVQSHADDSFDATEGPDCFLADGWVSDAYDLVCTDCIPRVLSDEVRAEVRDERSQTIRPERANAPGNEVLSGGYCSIRSALTCPTCRTRSALGSRRRPRRGAKDKNGRRK